MDDQDKARLRNTIYEQQTRSLRRLTRGRMLLYRMIVPTGLVLVRMVWAWSRLVRLEGEEHIRAALTRAPSFIPVYWHQQQLFCVKVLLGMRREGVNLGFLISPSVDGEIGALAVQRAGASVIRGSSSHTGARALRDYYQALVKEQVSPCITPDGPRGPPFVFKPGAILLSQMSQRPIIPMAFAASRAWQVQWDRFIIPWPFARIAVIIGEPVQIPKVLDAAALQRWQGGLELRLGELQRRALSALAS
ncbi:MAG: lysophospholipid acyltransferase family protein [Proteobacteria bacterium]|nr:lysophospholipid acyltransferase family protein [Pseudomonadota bacterium]